MTLLSTIFENDNCNDTKDAMENDVKNVIVNGCSVYNDHYERTNIVFGSMLIDHNSRTPYSDATQVILRQY